MARKIIKQPNGAYAIWSSIVDNFIWINLKNKEEILKVYIDNEIPQLYRIVEEQLETIENKNPKRGGFHIDDFKDAIETIEQVHGKDEKENVQQMCSQEIDLKEPMCDHLIGIKYFKFEGDLIIALSNHHILTDLEENEEDEWFDFCPKCGFNLSGIKSKIKEVKEELKEE